MSEALVAEGANLCSWYIMISEMPGPIYVRLSGIVMGRWGDVLGQKKIQNVDIEKIFLSYLCVRDDSLGFEDCRFATHLLNLAMQMDYPMK